MRPLMRTLLLVLSLLLPESYGLEEKPLEAVQHRRAAIVSGDQVPAVIASAQQPLMWQHRPGWFGWSVKALVHTCDGAEDGRLWYSIVGGQTKSEQLSTLGGRPARSSRSTELLPPKTTYGDRHHKRCLHLTLHEAIPFEHRIETYFEAPYFHTICRAPMAAWGWPSPARSGLLKGKWKKDTLHCFYSAEATYSLMLGVPQRFQSSGTISSHLGVCTTEVVEGVIVSARCPHADEAAVRAALTVLQGARDDVPPGTTVHAATLDAYLVFFGLTAARWRSAFETSARVSSRCPLGAAHQPKAPLCDATGQRSAWRSDLRQRSQLVCLPRARRA